MDRKDIKVKVFKEKIPVSLKPLEITLLGKPAEAVLYKADFLEGYAELRIALGNKNKVTIDELFPRKNLKTRLEEMKEEFTSIISDHQNFFDEVKNDDYLDSHIDSINYFDETIDMLLEYIEETDYEKEEPIHPDQISIFDLDDEE